MISVILDEEIVKRFKDKVFGFDTGKFVPGATIFSIAGEWAYNKDAGSDSVFQSGPEGVFQFDDEFAGWLEENRPEVFL